MVVADRPPAIEPRLLPTQLQEARRRDVIEAFVKWTREYPGEATTKRSLHDLEKRIGFTRKTIGKYFPQRECANNPWHAMCFVAVHVLKLYDPYPAPKFIRECANTYLRWRQEDQAQDSLPVQGSPGALTDDELVRVINDNDDITAMANAAEILTARLHRKLRTTSLFGATDRARREALDAADAIVRVANVVIKRVEGVNDRVDIDGVRRNCAAVIDAAIDAHRLRSRQPGREGWELGLLLNLRNKDLLITRSARSKPEYELSIYQRDNAEALMSADVDLVIGQQLAATEQLLGALKELDTEAWGDEGRDSQRRRSNHLEADKLLTVVTHIAALLAADEDRAGTRYARAVKCADNLLKLYGPGSWADRRDAAALLHAAREQTPPLHIAEPVSALRIVKFSGVGEILIARALVQIATLDDSTAPVDEQLPPFIDLYLGNPHSTTRRQLALRRAEGLYDRAIAWLRPLGISGALRDRAIAERERVRASRISLPEEERGESEATIDENETVHDRIAELWVNLNTTIVDGILRADLNSWSEVNDSGAKGDALMLIKALNEAWRYLRKPELGLRTDLPPPDDLSNATHL